MSLIGRPLSELSRLKPRTLAHVKIAHISRAPFRAGDKDKHFLRPSLTSAEGEDLVQYQRPTANDFWAAPDWALNVFNIHKQLYTVQLGRQRCTELSDRFAWLSTWDPADDGGEGSSVQRRVQRMTFITAFLLFSNTQLLPGLIDYVTFLSKPNAEVAGSFFPRFMHLFPVFFAFCAHIKPCFSWGDLIRFAIYRLRKKHPDLLPLKKTAICSGRYGA